MNGSGAAHRWKLCCTVVHPALPGGGMCHGYRDTLVNLSKVRKFGLCCFYIFSFQGVMTTFQLSINDFLSGPYLLVSGN